MELEIKNYQHRRKVICEKTGRFGFVHSSDGEKMEVFFPYPTPVIEKVEFEDLDCVTLDGIEFKEEDRQALKKVK